MNEGHHHKAYRNKNEKRVIWTTVYHRLDNSDKWTNSRKTQTPKLPQDEKWTMNRLITRNWTGNLKTSHKEWWQDD